MSDAALVRDRSAGVADRREQLGARRPRARGSSCRARASSARSSAFARRASSGVAARSRCSRSISLVQGEDGLERLVGSGLADAERRDAERREHRSALRALDRDLEGGALVGRLGRQQVVER